VQYHMPKLGHHRRISLLPAGRDPAGDAQSELSDPEMSLVATIGADRPAGGGRSFQYARLSSGFVIVRKAPGGNRSRRSRRPPSMSKYQSDHDSRARLGRVDCLSGRSAGWRIRQPASMGAALTYAPPLCPVRSLAPRARTTILVVMARMFQRDRPNPAASTRA
jgi:hypothetical protein